MIKTIPVDKAVGIPLAHDITEIRPGEFKGPAFKKGHVVCDEDICHLQKLGKNHLYVIDPADDEIHENEAAVILAQALAGEGIVFHDQPREGKIDLYAENDGMLFVNTTALAAFNLVDEVMCASLHQHTIVQKNQRIAATRAIPLIMKRVSIMRAANIAQQGEAVFTVKPIKNIKTGMVITGSEVYHHLIEDRFEPILTMKLLQLGSIVNEPVFAPDNADRINEAIHEQIEAGCKLLLLTGGMSVDPDDVTRKGIEKAGANEIYYGAAALPGAMFLTAYIDDVTILGVPACGLHHPVTVLDIVLPRILAGEKVGKKELAFLGHGGLCQDCKVCRYPHCPFGKGS